MWKKTIPLLVVAILAVGLAAGCAAKEEKVIEEIEHMEHMESSEVAVATDPACGMEVPMTKDAITYEHEGKTYYFCSASCKAEFVADPGKYVDEHHDQMHEGEEHHGM